MEIEQGDILICTVDKIVGTTVFVDIDGTEKKGTIILSEISAGRIRNLRDYVVPKKTIVCKVLRVMKDYIELSLRRVKEKEKKEILEKSKTEKSYGGILKSILKDKSEGIINKIKKEHQLSEFLEMSKSNSSELKKFTGEEDAIKIIEILKKHKSKNIQVKKQIKLTSNDPDGLKLIKKILMKKGEDIRYLAAGNYSLQIDGNDIKKATQKMKEIIESIELATKKENVEFSYN
ncbi:MAG: hypothetical protein NUV46_02215 [Nanoarchaeota archaeon]|nr:hypothetical protein [Nanoarchaeota archaeon]